MKSPPLTPPKGTSIRLIHHSTSLKEEECGKKGVEEGQESPVRRKMLFKINYILHKIWIEGEEEGRKREGDWLRGEGGESPRTNRGALDPKKAGGREGGGRGGSGGRGADKPKEGEGGEEDLYLMGRRYISYQEKIYNLEGEDILNNIFSRRRPASPTDPWESG